MNQNINHLWASLMVEELIRNGVDYFCVAPGSRSTPLTLAVAENTKAQSFVHFDERGLAFHALGYVSATGKPVVLICTSGTAAANFFPAIIEASKKKLPLIVLTADRPPELRATGAHQTIDQVKIFGEYVRWHFDQPCPTIDIPPEFILTTIDQAISRTKGELPGPVHINCMFREPLAPVKAGTKFSLYLRSIQSWLAHTNVYTQYCLPTNTLPKTEMNKAVDAIVKIKKGIIVVGKLKSEKERQGVLKLAEQLNWPIFPDVTSGLRLGYKGSNKQLTAYFDQMLLSPKFTDRFKPDGVLHLGGRITSKRWYEYMDALRPQQYIMVLNHPLRNDPLHNVSLRIQSPVANFCQMVCQHLPQRKGQRILSTMREVGKILNEQIERFLQNQEDLCEPQVARLITQNIPKDTGLFLANSMPIRYVDMFGVPDGFPVVIGGNRGASGIDGILASAAGFLRGLDKPVTLLIGDLACLHDLNSLSMLRHLNQPMVIVVLNNNGGGIFDFLPVAKNIGQRNVFEKFFAVPQDITFSGACDMFDLNYAAPETKEEFVKTYNLALKSRTATVLEIFTDRQRNHHIHERLQKILRNALKQFS